MLGGFSPLLGDLVKKGNAIQPGRGFRRHIHSVFNTVAYWIEECVTSSSTLPSRIENWTKVRCIKRFFLLLKQSVLNGCESTFIQAMKCREGLDRVNKVPGVRA